MLGRCQAPPPPPSPSPSDNPEEDNDLYFEDDDEGHPEFAALNAEFIADKEREAAKEDDADDLDFNDDEPNPEEKAIKQRAILAFYESTKKAEANAHAHKEADEV
jgi:hypothetical protein